jgi:hypothetical protein
MAQSGRRKSMRAQASIKTVREQIRRNPLRKQKIMSTISTKSMARLIRNDQYMRVHRRSNGHILTPALKAIRRTRAERLLR